MKHVDRLIISELVGPWAFGVAMFTSLIVASTFLLSASEYIVSGISPATIAELMTLFLPGVMVKTFPMAMLLAGLLGFGRLSSDSEITALRAAGVSIMRMMMPVAGLSLAVAIAAFFVNEAIVPTASLKVLEIKGDIQRTLNVRFNQPVLQSINRGGKMAALLSARDFDLHNRTLKCANVVSYDNGGNPTSWLYINELQYDDKAFQQGLGGWRIIGGAKMITANGSRVLDIHDQAWPGEVPKLSVSPADLITAGTGDQFDSFSMAQLRRYIQFHQFDKNIKPDQIRNWEFVYWNKMALPLAAIIYGLLGAPLGIRNQRTVTDSGFALAIVMIFSYVTLTNFLNVYAKGGVIPPYLASFTPLVIGLLSSGVIMWRRNL